MELPKLERGDLRASAPDGHTMAGGGACGGLLRDRLPLPVAVGCRWWACAGARTAPL